MSRRATLEETDPTGNGRARGLVSSRASGKRIGVHTYAPAADLADVVASYWAGRWDLRGQAPHTTELVSDPCVNVVFEDGGPHAGSRLVGVWTDLWRRTLEGKGRAFGIKLRPGAQRAFVDRPAVEFADRIVPLAELLGESVVSVQADVLATDDDAQVFGAIEVWLRAIRRADDDQVSLAIAVVDRITADPEITTVTRLADAAGLSPRALQRLFRDHVGASPKWVIRRYRLQEAAVRIERGEGLTLAEIAAELCYADQAHLAHDFKRVTGKTPSEFASTVRRDRGATPAALKQGR